MAARRIDAWLTRAKTPDPALLASLNEGSVPQVEARLGTLLSWPKSAEVADAALGVLADSRFRAREQLGAPAMAVGVALVHGATAGDFEKLERRRGLNKDILRWNQLVLLAAAQLRRKPSAGRKTDTTPLPRKGLHAAWLERAKAQSVDALPSLLSSLSDGPATQVTERALALISFPRDGRIADAAAALLMKPTVRSDVSVPFFPVLGMLLIAHGSRVHRETAIALTASIPTLRWVELLLPDDEPVSRAKPVPANGAPDSEPAFLAWIAEAPAELARRRLFADWLLERGHPRGEHAALQLAALERPLTPKESKRIAALEKQHAPEWLRSLGKGVLKNWTRFEGAVLSGLRVHAWRPAEVPEADDPQLATLTTFALDGGTNLPLDALLRNARWPLLKELELPARLLRDLPSALLERLETLSVTFGFIETANTLKTLASMELPALTSLNLWGRVDADDLPLLREVPALQRCTSVGLETYARAESFSALRTLPTLEALSLFQQAHLHTRDAGSTWRFSRSPDWKLAIELRPPKEYVEQFEADLVTRIEQLDAEIRETLRLSTEDGGPVPARLLKLLG